MAKPKWNLIHKWNLADFLESVSLCNSFNNEIIAYISIYSEKKKKKKQTTQNIKFTLMEQHPVSHVSGNNLG